MKTSKLILSSLLLTVIIELPAIAVPRVFVSGLGNDANPGSITSPKRSFASALTVTDAGGEIIVLDSAGYGPVTINKSVSIISPTGVYAGVTATSGDGITVNAGTGDVVTLRGLTLNGVGGGSGINFIAGDRLHVENCVVNGFSFGIIVDGGGVASAQLFVKDTTCRENAQGINIFAGNGTLDHVRLEGNTNVGLIVSNSGVSASIANSVVSGNNTGIDVVSAAQVNVESCVVANNRSYGVFVGAVCRISNLTVTDNGTGISNSGTVETRQNSTVRGNSSADTTGNAFVVISGV
jgi:parallel beta helix pectate lyase-like protein